MPEYEMKLNYGCLLELTYSAVLAIFGMPYAEMGTDTGRKRAILGRKDLKLKAGMCLRPILDLQVTEPRRMLQAAAAIKPQ